MSPYDRFLSWKNLAYAVGAILLGRIAYTLYAVYAQGQSISWYEHIYPVIMDIVAPGSMQIQYMLEYGVRQLPDNTTNPIGFTFALIGLILSVQAFAWLTIGRETIYGWWKSRKDRNR